MGCTSSSTAAGGDPNEVDLALIEQRMAELYKFKVLLLGAGESGKSTVTKQLKIIHGVQPSEGELLVVAASLHQNVVDCLKALGVAARTFGIEMPDDVAAGLERFMEHPDAEPLSPELADLAATLYQSECLQAAYARRAEFWLLDSVPYLMQNVRRFAEPGYVPTEEDTVMARVRTTGIIESVLEDKFITPSGPVACSFKVVDVGGQRNERKKWIHCFDNVSAILFVVNLGGYNQVMFEDSSKNRIEESLELFQSVASNPLFRDVPIFLLLNKKDIFEAELERTGLDSWLKGYTGTTVGEALEAVANEFRKRAPAGKEVPVEIVASVYKREIKCAFDDIKKQLRAFHEPAIEKERAELEARRKAIKNA